MTPRHNATSLATSTLGFQPRCVVPSDSKRPTQANVNLAHVRHNFRALQAIANTSEVWPVLKADGYGLGARTIARSLERAGADGFCVALLEEAIELREAGIQAPILVMSGEYQRAWSELLNYRLIPVLPRRLSTRRPCQ